MANRVIATLGSICSIVKGETGIASAVPGEYPLVTTAHERKTNITWQFDADAVCIPLVSSTGHGKKTLNRIHYQSGKFALGTILAAVIPHDPKKVSAAYIHRYLQFHKNSKLVSLMKGAANVSLAVRDIAKVTIELPPLYEQHKFVQLYDESERYAQYLGIEFEGQENILKLLRQSILQEAIEGKLTTAWRKKHPYNKGDPERDGAALLVKIREEKKKLIAEGRIRKEKALAPIEAGEVPFEVPEGWVWCRLGDICLCCERGISPVYCNGEGIPILNQKCIRWDHIDLAWIKKANILWVTKIRPEFKTRYADVLVNSTGEGTIGRSAVVTKYSSELFFDSHILRLSFLHADMSMLVSRFINSHIGQQQVSESKGAKTTKQTELGSKNLISFIFPLPPLAEQSAIVERAEALLGHVDELEKEVARRKRLTGELMREVLREAFEGGDA